MTLPVRYRRPSLVEELGWVQTWSLTDGDPPVGVEEINRLLARLDAELFAPAGDKGAGVALDRLSMGRRRTEGGETMTDVYLDVLGEIPADLLPLAVARAEREWISTGTPTPGFVRSMVKQEIAERELIAMKLRTMRLRLETDGAQRERFTRRLEADRRRADERNAEAVGLAARLRDDGARRADPKPEEAAQDVAADRAAFEAKLAEAFPDAGRGGRDQPGDGGEVGRDAAAAE